MGKGSGGCDDRTALTVSETGQTPGPNATRFAPSPTGSLHLGSIRTALFSYLLARQNGDVFTLRIEDTDQNRNQPEQLENILRDLQWLGLQWDGEVIYQSRQGEEHTAIVHDLLQSGHAYYDAATADDVKAWRTKHKGLGYRGTPAMDGAGAIRLRLPQENQTIVVDDWVLGQTQWETDSLDEFVIARADGSPTFLLANAYDDRETGVIIRGNDHFSNTPKQVLLREALGLPVAQWAHLPLILGPNGKKMSKRSVDSNGRPLAVTLDDFRSRGYAPEVLISYLSRLGWGEGEESFMTVDDLVERFDLKTVSHSSARFDEKKLRNINGEYLRSLATEDYTQRLAQFKGISTLGEREYKAAIVAQPKAQTLYEAMTLTDFLYRSPTGYDEAGVDKFIKSTDGKSLGAVKELLPLLLTTTWEEEPIQEQLQAWAGSNELKPVQLFQTLRLGISGKTVGPSIHGSLWALGQEETCTRLTRLVETLQD